MKTKEVNPSKTILTICLGFSILFFVYDSSWWLYASISIGVLGLLSDRAARLIHIVWMKLAKVLSYIVPNILMGLIFYLFLFPLSIFYKISGGKDALLLSKNNSSTWIHTKDKISKSSFEKMW